MLKRTQIDQWIEPSFSRSKTRVLSTPKHPQSLEKPLVSPFPSGWVVTTESLIYNLNVFTKLYVFFIYLSRVLILFFSLERAKEKNIPGVDSEKENKLKRLIFKWLHAFAHFFLLLYTVSAFSGNNYYLSNLLKKPKLKRQLYNCQFFWLLG